MWFVTMSEYRHIQKDLGKGFVMINGQNSNVSPYETGSNMQVRATVQWTLANYLLIKYKHTYYWLGGTSQYGQAIAMQNEYTAPIGAPTDDFYASQNVYMRDYTNGLAAVNPDSTRSYTINLPAGKYVDLYGNRISRYTMTPQSGLILLLASPGAATPSPTAIPTSPTPIPTSPTVVPTATPVPVSSGVNIDNASHGVTSGPATTLAWRHAIGTGSNRLLVVGVSSRTLAGGNDAVTGVTDNGVAMRPVTSAVHNYGTYAAMYELLNPPSGSNTITVSLSTADEVIGGAVSFSNVDQADPLGTAASRTATAQAVSVTVSTTTPATLVDLVSIDDDGVYTPGSGQTQQWQANSGARWYNTGGMSTRSVQAGSVRLSWSGIGSNDDAAEIAAPVYAAAMP
jgi:hypothetical protein